MPLFQRPKMAANHGRARNLICGVCATGLWVIGAHLEVVSLGGHRGERPGKSCGIWPDLGNPDALTNKPAPIAIESGYGCGKSGGRLGDWPHSNHWVANRRSTHIRASLGLPAKGGLEFAV